MSSVDEVEHACLYFTNLVQVAAWKNSPELQTCKSSTQLPLDVRRKIEEKRRLRRIWQQSLHPSDKTAFNRAIKELKTLLKATENESIRQTLELMSPQGHGHRSLWKATKNLKKPQVSLPPIRNGNHWARTDSEKAEIFGSHLASVFKPNEMLDSEDPDIDLIMNQDLQLSLPPPPTCPAEVKSEIKKLCSKKAPGFDLITPKLLKELPRKCVVFLSNLFNAIFRLSYFPNVWKISQIIIIHKAGKPACDASSYRPISLTPVLSKLWEKLFLTRLSKCLRECDIIPHHQFGFRKHHSTVEQVHRVYNTIRQCLETKKYCSAAFLDVQQAFDRVWHKGLLCKVKQLLPHPIYCTICSYLENRAFLVKQGEARSKIYASLAGVPQGSVLGPVLYNIFTYDLPQTSEVTIATYADDAAFLSSSVDPNLASARLQKQLNDTDKWLKKWRIKASAPKSGHITFTLRRGDCPPVKLDNTTLPQTNCVKYLGFLLDRRLTWKDHIKAKRDETNQRFKSLLWLLGRQSALSLNNKLLVYSSILKPIWIYGIQIWSTASKCHITCLQRVQNNILRVIAGAPWFARNSEIHDYLDIPTVVAEIDRYKNKYKERLSAHPNPLAYQLILSRPTKRLKRADVLLT